MTGQSLHERTVALLREIEWNGIRQDGEYCCPCCWMDKHRHGHKCELAAILAEHEHAAAGDEAEFVVVQDDMQVAATSGPFHDALRDAQHYALQYAQDGDVAIFQIHRTLVAFGRLCGGAEEKANG